MVIAYARCIKRKVMFPLQFESVARKAVVPKKSSPRWDLISNWVSVLIAGVKVISWSSPVFCVCPLAVTYLTFTLVLSAELWLRSQRPYISETLRWGP